MKRAFLYILDALFLLMFLSFSSLWVRSYWRGEFFHWYGRGHETGIFSTRGLISWYEEWEAPLAPSVTEFRYYDDMTGGLDDRVILLKSEKSMSAYGPIGGFGFFIDRAGRCFTELMIPYWFFSLLSALGTFCCWRLLPGRRRAGFCVKCGYDLRANHDRCPECGTAFVSTPAGDAPSRNI